MKTITKLFVFIILVSFSNLVFANDWVYAGRYLLRSDFSHTHHTDVFLMNHLTSYSKQLVGTEKMIIASMMFTIRMIIQVIQVMEQKNMMIEVSNFKLRLCH
ncbi:hypothetical protein SOV_36210 [Sporomusa ovata DSM 2662]|uniref:hypothetical protein n=1 Tax=Sporomusa ovata TaxID=2378 RepID=UPI0003884EB0|nr:hypothetical protein [Sporomusa ovata]EQB24770.1 hypothetical protein SOV_6c01840 [Sporomusa ovata DSM 2662]